MSEVMDHRKRLADLREEFLHRDSVNSPQDLAAQWWAGLAINERTLILAAAGMEASEAAARRQWRQMLQDTRDRLLTECKRLARLIDPLRWV